MDSLQTEENFNILADQIMTNAEKNNNAAGSINSHKLLFLSCIEPLVIKSKRSASFVKHCCRLLPFVEELNAGRTSNKCHLVCVAY
jgi:hypothetical protein